MRSTLRHFSSFDGEEKMALNQIKFNFSAGGLKQPKFKRKSLSKNPMKTHFGVITKEEMWKDL